MTPPGPPPCVSSPGIDREAGPEADEEPTPRVVLDVLESVRARHGELEHVHAARGVRLRDGGDLGETGSLSQGVQARRKALRIRYINGMEVPP